ncbi:calcium-binding protein [Roseivivax sp. CAU 1753]
MPNTLTISVRGKDGANIAELFDALEQGVFSTSGMGNELTAPEGTALFSTSSMGTELRIDYVTIDGQLHATGFQLGTPTPKGLEIEQTANFSQPQPLGGESWIEVLDYNAETDTDTFTPATYEALLGDSRIDMKGGNADDWITGSEFGDRFNLGGGDDAASGGDGNDQFKGGKGNDLLIGGADNDKLVGGNDNDLLILGTGNDSADGGNGNDVLIFTSGQDVAKGGNGSDIFIFDSFSTTASGSPNVQTRVNDFDPDDILVFSEFDSALPEDFAGETLADLENGTIDDFMWRETKQGVQIQAGDAQVYLKGVSADEIDIDQLLFSDAGVEETAALFDTGGEGGTLGTPLGGDPYLIITMENVSDATMVGAPGGAFETWGGDSSGFITFGAETSL